MFAGNEAFRKRAVAIRIDLVKMGDEDCPSDCRFSFGRKWLLLSQGGGGGAVGKELNLLWQHGETGGAAAC